MPQSGQNIGVTAYISPEMKKELEEWADEEERSMSWLVAKLIEEALLRRRQQKGQQSLGQSEK